MRNRDRVLKVTTRGNTKAKLVGCTRGGTGELILAFSTPFTMKYPPGSSGHSPENPTQVRRQKHKDPSHKKPAPWTGCHRKLGPLLQMEGRRARLLEAGGLTQPCQLRLGSAVEDTPAADAT